MLSRMYQLEENGNEQDELIPWQIVIENAVEEMENEEDQ